MPKLWSDTIKAHRHDVRDAILGTTATLVMEQGLHAVTMSQIAEEAGIGRATLYKYFPDVEAILVAWHERHVSGHLSQLAKIRDETGDQREQLEAVLESFALIIYERARQHGGTEIAGLVHRSEHIAKAEQRLRDFVEDLLKECARAGIVRHDISAEELATYCLNALMAASSLKSKVAVRRLVEVTLTGLGAED